MDLCLNLVKTYLQDEGGASREFIAVATLLIAAMVAASWWLEIPIIPGR